MVEEQKDTRQKLLDAAENLFADNGLEAVSIRDIATAAEVNVAAVNYHFQGKDNLYVEVLRQVMKRKQSRYVEALNQEMAQGSFDLEYLLRTFYRSHFEDTLKHRSGGNFLKLLVREVHHGSTVSIPLMKEFIFPMWEHLAGAIMKAVPALSEDQIHWIIGSLHGQLIHFTMRWHKSQCSCPHDTAPQTVQELFPSLADDVDTYIDRAVDHITRFSVAGIEAMAAGAPSKEGTR